jgi:hypothetical protein
MLFEPRAVPAAGSRRCADCETDQGAAVSCCECNKQGYVGDLQEGVDCGGGREVGDRARTRREK